MTDLSPMLQQEQSNAPMLGGDRRIPEPCEVCGQPRIRDFFGYEVCVQCAANVKVMHDLLDSPKCPHCGSPDGLLCEMSDLNEIFYIFCDMCSLKVWIALDYVKKISLISHVAYLTDTGFDEDYAVEGYIDDGPADGGHTGY